MSTPFERPTAPAGPISPTSRRETLLILSGQRRERERLARFAAARGYLAVEAADVSTAVRHLSEARPDIVILPGTRDGLDTLARLRAEADAGGVAAVVLTRRDDLAMVKRALELGADDVVPRSAHLDELAARVRARLDRRPVPRSALARDPVTGALTPDALQATMRVEFERVRRTRRHASFAYLAINELPIIEAELGQRARDTLVAQIVDIIERDGRQIDITGLSRDQLALLLPDTSAKGARVRLNRIVQKLHREQFSIDGEVVRITPVVGFVAVNATTPPDEVEHRAWTALMRAATQLDLYPVEWRPVMGEASQDLPASPISRWLELHRTALQVVAQQAAIVLLPLLAYATLDRMGTDITGAAYLAVVVALAVTAASIWVESIAAFEPETPPNRPRQPYPPATAIVAAYLPNEADTVMDTARAFLRQDYPDLQVILAYNTPHDLPVERELAGLAGSDPRLVLLRVRDSVSKAQNVNAALAHVRGEFVGVFDADHHPARTAFRRAWRWISHGVDVVQGHCVVREGADRYLGRLVTTEFEAIYAVAHPGRARVHGFGIFGGSNGYWRTDLLQRTRMRGFMLTEDIDSSMRVVAGGGRIVSDPGLVSTELAPPSWRGLWNQRLRWAQGWSQVSLRHLVDMLRNDHLSGRQRLGLAYLLGWREIYPWISLQAFPILLFWFLRGSPPIDWFIPLFVFTTLFTMSAGVMQAWAAWRLARPYLRAHRRWFVVFGLASLAFYTEYMNVITRTAHLKELMRERQWKVTPRPIPTTTGAPKRLIAERSRA